jgi:hypothetical protein
LELVIDKLFHPLGIDDFVLKTVDNRFGLDHQATFMFSVALAFLILAYKRIFFAFFVQASMLRSLTLDTLYWFGLS